MKTFLKVLKISLIAIISFFVLLLIAGWVFQDKISDLAEERVSEIIGAPMGIDKTRFSLISEFPNAAIQFEGLWIGSIPSDSLQRQTLDTLAKIGKLRFAVKTGPLLDNVFKVQEIKVEGGFAKYFVDETGGSNFDFLMATDTTTVDVDEDTTSSPMPTVSLDKMTLKDFTCYYKDDLLGAGAKVYIPGLEVSAHLDSVRTDAGLSGQLDLKSIHFEGTNLYRLKDAKLEFDLAYDTDSVAINDFKATVDETVMSTSGRVFVGETIFTDLSVSLSIPDLAGMSKYAPDDIFNEYQISQLAGGITANVSVNGVYSETSMPHYEASFDLKEASIRAMEYPLVYNLNLKGSATNGNRNNDVTTSLNLDNLSFDLSGNSIALSGKFRNLEKLNYQLRSQVSMDLDKLKKFVPDSVIQNPSGKVVARLETRGVVPDSVDDVFINDALRQTKLNLKLDQLSLDMDTLSIRRLTTVIGYADNKLTVDSFNIHVPQYELDVDFNGLKVSSSSSLLKEQDTKVVLPKYRLRIPGNSVTGSLSVSNLQKPTFSMGTQIKLDLAKLMKYAPEDMVKSMKGKLNVKINSNGKLDLEKIEEQIEDVVYDNTTIDVDMKGITLDMVDEMMGVSKLNGNVKVGGHKVTIKNLSGVYNSIDFQVPQSTIENPFNTAARNQPGFLKVDGEYHLGDIDYMALGALMAGGESETSSEGKESEPIRYNLDVRGKVSVKSLRYDSATLIEGITAQYQFADTVFEAKGKFAAERVEYGKAIIDDVSGLFNVKDSTIVEESGASVGEMVVTLDQLKYKAFEGSGMSSMKVELRGDDMYIKMKNEADNINMRQVFKDMDDFGQSELISYENIDGYVSSEGLYIQMKFIGDSLLYEDIRLSGDFSLRNGGIYNYEAVKAMEALPGMKDLDSLFFKPINNKEVYAFKNDLAIPRILLISNKFDAEFRALQSFGEDFKYIVSIPIGQFIAGKSKKRKQKQEALGDKATDSRSGQKFKDILTSVKDGKMKIDLNVVEKEKNQMNREIKVIRANNKIQFHPERFNFDTGVE